MDGHALGPMPGNSGEEGEGGLVLRQCGLLPDAYSSPTSPFASVLIK